MTPEYVLLTAATDVNRLAHPPIIFQAFVHITATDTPLGKATHRPSPDPRSGEVLCGELDVQFSWGSPAAAPARRGLVRACSFLASC